MSNRIATIIVLCEDQEQQNLIRRYLLRAGHEFHAFRFEQPRGRYGAGSQYVREQFPRQVAACRRMLGKKTRSLLIVMTDADNLTHLTREQTLHNELALSLGDPIIPDEPIVILVPKWQVETWIRCLLGQPVDEGDKDSDRPPVTADEIKTAALTLYDWSRPGTDAGETCVASLRFSLPRWRRIG